MCGICGFVGKGNLDDLRRMTSFLHHRGPDAEGLWCEKETGVYLGHRRLSIIDLACGCQPMWTRDHQLGIVFNGEIYNHLELRRGLVQAGHCFVTDHSDTEVLLQGYRQWGRELPRQLNGMWAFAIYDGPRNELFLSRDRFGKKPLYYTLQNGTFAFASELKALIRHKEIQISTSTLSLKKYFAYGFIPAPHSLYKSVHKLPGGHNLVLNLHSLEFEVQKYWSFVLEPFAKVPVNAEQEWGAEIRSLLSAAVKRRLMSDVPIGVFLSGGIDSSSVAAYAVKNNGGGRIKSFCVGFDEASFDETKYSRRAASFLGTEHFWQKLSVEKSRELLPEIATRLDEPMGDGSLLPTFLLCREARKHVTVAVGGDGADELFAGYDPFRALRLAELYQKLVPRPMHKAIRLIISLLPTSHRNLSLDFRIKRTLRGLTYPKELWNPVWLGALAPDELEELFLAPAKLEEIYEEAIRSWECCGQKDLVNKTLQFYTDLYLQDDILVKVDRASMMNSLEVRAPYLDIELVDFVRRVPYQFKIRNGQTKYLLKKSLEPLLPRDIIYREKKGFGMPIGKWFREGALAFDMRAAVPPINLSFVQHYLGEHRRGRHDHRAFLWNHWILTHSVA